MDERLTVAVASAIAPFVSGSRILNVAAVVDDLAKDFPEVEKSTLADLVREKAVINGVTILMKPIR